MNIESKAPELRDLDTIYPYPLNAKKHEPSQVKRLANSIRKFGWRGNPVIVDKFGVIISGHGRRLAAMELGLKQVPVVVEDDMSASEARAFRLADNRAAVSDIDNDILKEELLDLGDEGNDLLDDIFDKKELDFAVIDLMEINDGVFEEDLNMVMDEQQEHTNDKIEAAGTKRIPIGKAFGFKDFSGNDVIYVTRLMAQLEAQTGVSGDLAFVAFAKNLVGDISQR